MDAARDFHEHIQARPAEFVGMSGLLVSAIWFVAGGGGKVSCSGLRARACLDVVLVGRRVRSRPFFGFLLHCRHVSHRSHSVMLRHGNWPKACL